MALCFVIAGRSLDAQTKHGSLAVAPDKTVLALGYNSPPRGMDDSVVPTTRPEKYPYMVHSEAALIANAAKHGISLDGASLYITGFPCNECFRLIINSGFKRVIFGPQGSNCVDSNTRDIVDKMNSNKQLELVEYTSKNFFNFLQNRIDFLNQLVFQ